MIKKTLTHAQEAVKKSIFEKVDWAKFDKVCKSYEEYPDYMDGHTYYDGDTKFI